jgi:phage repressor protein C with HTH and peptisase S24 domain
MLLGLRQQEMAERLGISRPYLSEIENERRQPSEALLQKLAVLRSDSAVSNGSEAQRYPPSARRGVPVISWARAGAASSYEEMPLDWQEVIPSDCPDENAFALILEGDSMEPRYFPKDVVVLMPTRQPGSNQLVGAKIREQGVVFKILTVLTDPRRFRLSSYNSAVYPPVELREIDFEWIYPAYEMRRRIWHL